MVGTVVPESIKTFVDLLSYRASIQPDVLAFRFLSYSATGIEADTITFKALDSRARQIAKQLLIKCQPGDRALMLYPSGIDFIAAYFGCLYAGVIAVPGYPPKRNQKLGRLKSLVQNCQAKVAMTDLQTQLIAEPQFDEVDELKSLAWVITDTAGFNSAEDVGLPQVQADDIAFLQYTSGSTGDPKGVMVTHANLMANSRSIYTAMEHGPDTVFVGWLPLFHDMGLIGNVLQPIYAGIPSTLMAPASFLQRPMRWLEAISKYKATTSGGPNFSYDLCVDSIKDEDLVQLDLRSWTIAFNGAEPIRPETLRTFSDKFSRCGFDPASHYACYGMAETTLLITGAEPGKGTRTTHFDENQLQQKRAVMVDGNTAPGHELVSCGNARCEQGVVIVNPDTMLRCAEGEVGEVWAHGDSNAKGYWQRQDATATTFAAYISDTKEGPYLRTGDLGFVHQGELYIAGRLKDVVIIRGMNHYPQDIELTAFESHEAFMPNGAAVFTVEEKGQEQLVIVLEIRRTYLRTFDPEALARAIQQAVVLQHELQVRSIVFIKPGQLPKTSSGKVQRQRCKQQFLDHQIEAIGRIDKSGDISVEDVKRFDKDAWQALPDSKRAAAIEDYIAALFEAYAKLSAGSIQRDVAFIGYGLDSLTLTQIAARISDELDINLQVQNLFEVETVHKLSVALNAKLLDPANKRQRITPIAKHGDRYPLSFAQQRMWFLMQYEASALYNIHGVLRIEGDLNVNALDHSFQEIMHRHEALRTRFVLEQTEQVQIVDQLLGWKLSVVDMSDRTQVEVDQAIDHELNFVFDLSEDILFRATVYKQPDGAHSLVVCMHHIISDGWSISVLMQELSSLYGAYTNEQASPLQPLPIQYPDYAIWQRAYLTGDVLQRQENYWKSQLKGVTPIALPTDKARPATPTYAGHSIPVQLDVELTQQLKSLSKEQGVTLYMTLLTAFGVLLHKYSGQDDICIGTPIANRTMTETKNLMGFFVNTIAMRADYGNDPLFRDALHHTKALTVDAYAHQDLPFEKVVDLVQTERDISTSPLFQIMFVLQDVDPGSLSLPGLQVQKTATVSATSKFDITLELFETAEGLCGNFEYKTDLFDASTIERLSSHFKRLLAQIIQSPNANISKLSLLDDSERQALLSYGNAKTNDAFAPVCSHLLFEAQAEKNPTAIALQFNQHTMTYGELNRRANQLAHYLVVHGVKPDTLVGLCIDRSFEMVMALLGIMKAGGAYVAFDPTYPVERLQYLLEDSSVKLVITQSALADVLPLNGQQPVFIDNSWLFDPQSSENLSVKQIGLRPESLAYVIYTSGSTGNPKASLLMHKGLSNLAQAQIESFEVDSNSQLIQFASFAFDAATSEIFMALCAGATLHIVPKDIVQSGGDLSNYVARNKITHATLPPALLAVLDQSKWQTVSHLVVAGEQCQLGLMKKWAEGRHFYNAYGPSETTVCSSIGQLTPESDVVHMGKPMRGVQLYVLDGSMQPTPVGVAGQLYVGGCGVGRGYLGRDQLNQEKFVDNPFGEGKLYVTGDLTRCLKDGNLEFIGRIDNQVKMRGFRIELGEIESALTKQQGIVDSIVTVHKDRENNQRLVAYVVVEPGVFDAEVVRNNLVASMPSYMVPSIFSPLEQFPLTSNGKIDRKRLPEPDFKNLATVEYVAPRSQTEQKLAVIWAELLGAEKIGIHHNFFNLGGHSLLAMRMVAQIREHWKIDFPIKSVFEAQELHALADLIDQAASSNSQPIERVPRGEPLPLSYAQQRLWIVNAIESDSAQYNMPAAIDFDGELNVIALESALNAFVGRHEIVRTVYVERDGLPYQYIRESVDFELKKIDLSHFDSVEQSKTLDTYTKQEALAPFDLANDLMLRATLIILSDKRYTLLATMHHIASDGWSTGILVKELAELYSAFVENRKTDLPELSCQYADYAAWQRKTLAGEKLQALLSYWRGQLAQLPSVHNLPLDRPRLAQPSHAGGVITQHISADIVTGLQRVAKESNATFFMTFHAAFAGILHRYSGETDIVLGTPVANRDMVELEPQVGLFVNTLVVRSDFYNDLTFLELLEQGKATLLNAYEHQELPFDMVVNELQVERSQSFNPLFQVMLAFQSSGENRLQLARLDSVEIRETVSSTKFDLTLNVVESENGLKLTWEYAKDLFDESTIRRLSSHFKNLLSEIVNTPNTSLRSLPLLDEEERRCLIESWNDTDKNYPRKQTLHQLFEAQVARTPDHAALVYEDKALTYAELNAKANQLAHYLRAQGVGPDVLVGVCTERSIEMVVALYGILKAGGGYVPFDPAYPKERLVFMLEDSKPSVMLTQQHLLDSLPTSDITTFCLDTQWSLVESQPTSNPKNHTDEANLAYVIFTSGSTGRPKGVGIEHAGIVNRLQWMQEEYQLTAADRVLQKTPFSFDVSVWEFFWPLLEGATLVVAKPGGHQDVNYLTGLIAAQRITTMHFVPPMLEVFLSTGDMASCSSLRQVMCSGQALPLELQQRFLAQLPEVGLHNLYGPTEASVDVTYWQCKEGTGLSSVPIGKPIANIQIHILDANLNPVPVGVAGELHIAGIGLARGYLNRPDLTAEKFIPNPFSKTGGARMYKSGDLARYLQDGTIEYLGRIDDQVKIRGFRIELGEIENVLAALPVVRDVVLLAREDVPGDKRLVAYIVPHTYGEQPDVAALRASLLQSLPDYMVPAHFIFLDHLPLTTNGKIDRRSLPAPDVNNLSNTEYVAPCNAAETQLAAIWCELLNLDDVGVHHNFFDLGGHSLLAIQTISRIKENFGVQLKVADLFVYTSIAALAKRIAEVSNDESLLPQVEPRTDGNIVPLSLEQQSYWFLYEMEGGTATYNIPAALRLMGKVDIAALDQSFTALISRHESLRTIFAVKNGAPSQQIFPSADFKLIIDSKKDNRYKEILDKQIELDARYVFDLKKEIPIRAVLHRIYDDDYVLTVLLHHTMADGWSLDILMRELAQLYNAYAGGNGNPLAPLQVQYGDYAVWQKQNLVGSYYEKQVGYWRDKLKGVPPMIDLPTDYPRPPVQSYRGREVGFVLPFELTQALNAFSRKHNTTLFNTLVAGLNVLLSRYSRSEDIVVGTAVANRSQTSLEPLIGCFANTLVLRNKVDQTRTFVELVKRVNGVVFEAYEHAEVPLDVVVDAVQPERSLGVPPLFQVMFRLHNHKTGQGIQFSGLEAERIKIESESAKLDLNFSLAETDGGIEGILEYATDLFTEKTIRRIARHFQMLLESAMANPDADIESLNLLSKEEFDLVENWNNTVSPYPADECVYHLFEKTCAQTPDKLAYVCGNDHFTYAKLNAKANQLAHYLQSIDVGPEVRVGVSVGRTAWAGVSMLAVFKAGGTYVPLDPNYPRERIGIMLDVVKPKIILTTDEISELFDENVAQVIHVEKIQETVSLQSIENLSNIGADHSAYILFTSGTTGRPKAILISHRSFRNMPESHHWAKLHSPNNRVLQFASLSFSISMWDSFMAWVPGGTLIAVTQDEALPGEALYGLLEREKVTHATWPVSLLSTLPVERMPSSLQTIISSAEPCNDAVVARWTARGVRFLNMYGNSEVSLGSTLYEYHKVGQKLTIGVAFPNTRMYLLDKYLRQVPIGVIAEIHTAGAGLATCYWDNPEATANSFIPNPFAIGKPERLYKTGDLGRYLPNGEIEFIGREDFQVSIRGFRVELVEIENVLRAAPGISDVVVVSQLDANKVGRLVCFYVEKADAQGMDAGQLRSLLSRKLPSYMVPSLFVKLDAMPLTPNRKVDRLGLPKPTIDDDLSIAHVAPGNPLEEKIAAIWSEVLGQENISVNRNFFEVGGHSLLAVQVVSRIKDGLGLPLTIKDLFTHTTIESLAAFLAEQQDVVTTVLPVISKRAESGRLPLSLDQKPYWFLHQLEGGSYTYNIPFAMRMYGELNIEALQKTFQALIERHESLRTLFPAKDGEPSQEIVPASEFKLQIVQVAEENVKEQVQADFTYIFDLEHELPIRIRLLTIADDNHVVTLVVHHVVADGWSLNILMNELIALYSSFSAGKASPLPPLELQYGDYSQWQQKNIIGDTFNQQTDFWKKKLDGLAPLLNLPLDYPRPPIQSYRGKELPISLPFSLTARLNQYARQHNTTLYNLLLSGLAILLSRYGRTNDIPVGTAVANRPQKELEPLIGCFANTLVIRCRVNAKDSFQQLVAAVGNEALEAFSNSSVPFDGVVEAVQPERSLGVPPIFQVMFRLHNQQLAQTSSFAGLRSELINLPTQSAKLDLNFSLAETADGLKGVIEFATDIFSEQTVARIAKHYQTILEAAIADSTIAIEKLSVVTEEEIEQVRQWNSNVMPYPQDECMHHLFERTVERMPNKLAYVSGDERYTFTELNARANRLAHFLQSKGVGPEVRVGVAVERSTWAGISGLAVAKSGGTYMPLDVNYPKDRIDRMLEVAKPQIVLTLEHLKPLFADTGADIFALDTCWQEVQAQPIFNPPRIGADHSAYILFTSGTTGKPKGILVAHRAFRNMANAQQWAGLHSVDSRVLQFASLSFSISFWGAYMAWVPGGTIYSVTSKQNLPDEPLYEFMEENQITHATWPVSMLSTMPVERMPKSLRVVISSAEPCNDAVVAKWTASGVRFLNLYGNSEVSIGSTLYEYKRVGEKLTIGKAFPNTQMYLLDENLKQVPIGVIAEIHTAGVGLATCYVDDPVATAKSFIANPFSDDRTSRMYKTGDLGRYLPNGEIEFIGREDFQVSIRGFRVELTEIEDVLRTLPGVMEVVVNSRDDEQGLARLACFYTRAADAHAVTSAELRKVVSEKLPNYMVPSLFVELDVMPLTPNRKIDRLALQSYPIGEGEDDLYVAPKSPAEKKLAAIWSVILGMQDIGIHHDFFELGGHSLLATKIVARIRSEFSVELSLQQFFENSTIERLAVVIEHANASYVENPIRILDQRDKVPLSFAQQRLWFLDRYEENSNFYHMPSVLKIAGDLDIDALNRAFVTLIERHEILRTNFISDQGQGFQKIHPSIDWSMDVIELDGESNEERESQFSAYIDAQLKTAFSLESDALLRVSLYKLTEGEYRLFINMHHIIADGWSITVLINEITALYSAYVNKVSAALKDLPVQYADYSVSQIEYLQGPVLTQQSIYWSKKLKDLTTISLPLDFERPRNQTYNGDRTSFVIDKATVVALDELSNQQGVTLFMTLLSAFNVLLGKYSGDTDISIGTPIANRVRAEIEPLIGFFANTLTLRSDLDGDPTFAGLLQQVKNTTLEAYSNQDIPFEKVVDLVLPERDSSRSPLFQVSFSFQQNPPARSFTLPGITIDNVTLENKTAKFDLLLEFMTTPDGLSGSFEYNTDLFKRETIEGFVSSLSNLINAVISDPQRKLSGLSLIADARIEPVAIALDAYPILRALYGNAIAPEGRAARYYLLDDMANLVPHGVVGKLYFDLQSDPDTLTVLSGRIVEVNLMGQPKKLLSSGFTARHTSNGLALLSSVDDVALINNQLIYPRVIEQQLLTRPDVQDCHVAIRRHAELGEQIVVYLVCQDDAPDANDFTQYLQSAGFADINVFACVKVGTIPLTRHGEVNARELHKYAVHNQATRQLWAEKVSQLDKVDEVVVASQVNNAQQAVSHLLDLLPIEARGSSSNIVSVVSKAKKVSNESISTAPAVIISESIVDMIHRPNLLSDMIVNTAQSHADKAIEFYHADNSTGSMSYAELLLKAQCVLGGLQATGLKVGSKVIFQFDRNEDFIVSFWACQLGGFIPVPIAAAKNYRTSNAQTVKVAHAWKLMDNAIVLTGAAIHDGVCNIAKLESIDDFNVHDITELYQAEPVNAVHHGATDDVALIMLTSGSTGLPKGVQLTHANLIGRTLGSTQMNGFHSDMVSLNWMALDHVGGIIYFHIRDTYLGATQIQVDTDYILADPLRWLRLIDQHKVNITWAPNFAFALIVERQEELKKLTLDLSCLHFMLNGAEAVVPKTTQAFIELLQQFNLAEDSVKPVFGMSEISSGVTYAKRLQLTYGSDDTIFVSVGRPIPGVNMRIVDENDQVMMEGQSGRLQVSGVTVTKGYLGGADVNKDVFTQDGWFKTGDLAFIQNGELTITGREKDVIIINGVNFYSHEIAEVAETVPGVVVSYTGACAVRRNGSNSDQLAIFFNTAHKGEPLLATIKLIRQAVVEKIGINPSFIVPAEKDQVPKTEIGKIQLSKLAQSFNRGEFDHALRALDLAERNENTLPDWSFSKTWIQKRLQNVVELPPAGATLVFADFAGCAAALDLAGTVITVTQGSAYQERGDAYQINPGIQAHYVQMVASLLKRSIVVSRVVNLWDYESNAHTADALLTKATLSDAIGMYSAWYLAQAFAALETPPAMRWIWAARKAQCVNKDDLISPDKAATLALMKTLPKEFSWLKCHHVDFAGGDATEHAALLHREIVTYHAIDEVAYRDGKRLVVRLRKERRVIREKREMPLVSGGGYLISGGLGGIGYELARMLLKQFNAKLLLVGRTPLEKLSAEKKDMLDHLHGMGNVQYANADICNHAALESVVDNAESAWKQKLSGVFHLAGLAHEEAMAGQSIHSLHEVLRAKTSGTRVLYNICNRRTDTLFVNFSSVNGFFGGSGMAAYNIGNRYQEAFVESIRDNKNVRSICISWSLWHDTGMGSQYKQAESLSKALGFTPIVASKGLFSMLVVLYHGRRNVLIGLDDTRPNIRQLVTDAQVTNRQLVCYFAASEAGMTNEVAASTSLTDEFGLPLQIQYVQVEALPKTASGAIDMAALRQAFAQTGSVKTEKIAPRDELEETLTAIASTVFGAAEPIGIKDNFFDVGANSLLIVKLHHEIQQQLNIEFPMVELFNSTTIEKLAIFLGRQDGQTPAPSADAARNAGQERRAAMQRRNRSRERKTSR